MAEITNLIKGPPRSTNPVRTVRSQFSIHGSFSLKPFNFFKMYFSPNENQNLNSDKNDERKKSENRDLFIYQFYRGFTFYLSLYY